MMGDIDWLGQIFGAVPEGDTSWNERVALAMVRNGLAVVLIKPKGSYPSDKTPLCPLNAKERKAADVAAQDAARKQGATNWDKVKHECSYDHVISEEKHIKRAAIQRALKGDDGINGPDPDRRANLAVSLPYSTRRVLIVDVDTESQRQAFLKDWSEHDSTVDQSTPLTVESPGVFADETWKHRGGGHMYFDVPDGVELPERTDEVKWCGCHGFASKGCEKSWAMFWTGMRRYVLVPPSTRKEGPYRVTGSVLEAPAWLIDIAQESANYVPAVRVGELNNDHYDDLNVWQAEKPWGDLLTPVGCTEYGTDSSCGCPVWTKPGGAANPKSMTAHDVGCGRGYDQGGHGPLHIWSDAWGPADKKRMTKLSFVALMWHGGDDKAAMDALGIKRGPANTDDGPLVLGDSDDGDWPDIPTTTTPDTAPKAPSEEVSGEPEATQEDEGPLSRNPLINWANLFTQDFADLAWLPGKIMTRGQLAALVGEGKAGKSLFSQEWAWRISAGLPFLGDEAREPLRVLYLDRENTQQDIQERMLAFGATPDALANLAYASFPGLEALDSVKGGQSLAALVQDVKADVVFIDTISRFVKGPENDADTWTAAYRLSLAPLKGLGVSVIRLDHFGKDKTRGARGNSAKTQDVDHVWELTESGGDGQLRLERQYSRTGHGERLVAVQRLGEKAGDRWAPGKTRHVLSAFGAVSDPIRELLKALDDHGVDKSWGRTRVEAYCRDHDIKTPSTKDLSEVVRLRKRGVGVTSLDAFRSEPEADPFEESA